MADPVAPAAPTPAPAAPATPPANPAPAAPAAPATPPAAPAAVDYKFAPVEGVAPEFDASVAAAAKVLGLDQAAAEKFRAHEIEGAKAAQAEATKAQEKAQAEYKQALAQEEQEWIAKNKAHPDFGGAKYDETTTRIGKVLAEFDKDGALKADIDKNPRVLHAPAFRAFLARIAYAHGEGKFVQAPQAPTVKSDAELFYGKQG